MSPLFVFQVRRVARNRQYLVFTVVLPALFPIFFTKIFGGMASGPGEYQRQAALYTDAGFVEDFRGLAEDDVAAIATPSPGVLPPLWLVTVRDVVVLDDGRVGAVVVTFTSEVERDDYLFFVEQGGRYLVDHFVDEYVPWGAGTPTP